MYMRHCTMILRLFRNRVRISHACRTHYCDVTTTLIVAATRGARPRHVFRPACRTRFIHFSWLLLRSPRVRRRVLKCGARRPRRLRAPRRSCEKVVKTPPPPPPPRRQRAGLKQHRVIIRISDAFFTTSSRQGSTVAIVAVPDRYCLLHRTPGTRSVRPHVPDPDRGRRNGPGLSPRTRTLRTLESRS